MNEAPPKKLTKNSFNGHQVKKNINQSDILNDALDKLSLLKDRGLADFDHLRITKEKAIVQSEPVITIGGAAVASPGNITGISAAAKAGKTAIVSLIAAGAISVDGVIEGFPDFKVLPNPHKKAVVVLDTEQSADDQQYNVVTSLKRAGIDSTPNYFRAYNIRQLKTEEYQEFTDSICELCNDTFGGIHLIIIDGGADYILSVNDEAAAARIVQYFTHISIRYSCPVVVIIHVNPGSDKERGHFGSEIQRKCYGLLTLTREGDISTLAPKIMRKASNADIPLISFTYSKDKGFHVPTEIPDREEIKVQKDRERHAEIAKQIFKPLVALSYSDAVSKVMQLTNRKERTAKEMISNMSGWNYIKKHDDGLYRIYQQ